jgi:hypothetical protein
MSGQNPQSNISAKTRNLAGYTSIAPAPTTVGGKVALEKPPAKLPAPTGVATITPVKTKNVPRTYLPTVKPPVAVKPPAKKPTVVVKPTAMKPAVRKSILSDLRSALGMGPSKSAPRGSMAINPSTGNTTGFTTGTTTGSSVSKPGVAGKTYQSAGDALKANTERRFGGYGPTSSSRSSGSSRSSTSGSSRSTSSGGGFLGGAAGRLSEPRGSKK